MSSRLIHLILDEADCEVVSITDGAGVLVELGRRKFDLLSQDRDAI